MPLTRRTLLQTTVAASLVYSPLPLLGATQPLKRYKTAQIGTSWWGRNCLTHAMMNKELDVVAVCDVDQRERNAAITEVEQLTGKKPTGYNDYREMLAKEKPEIVLIITPDHWHALQTIAALEAGAHVFLDKPIAHTIAEGQAIVRAAKRTGKLVQVNLHRRAAPHHKSAMEFLRAGKAGKIGMVRAFVQDPNSPASLLERKPDIVTPKELDWEMWCGPAPLRPFNPTLHPVGWRSYLDYANGTLGDWGVHWMDQILWWTDEKYPRKIFSSGSRKIVSTNGDTPDTQIATFEFEGFTATWEHRSYAGNHAEKHNIGCYFYGTEGTFHLGVGDGWTFYPVGGGAPLHEDRRDWHEVGEDNVPEMMADLLRSIETGKKPVCDIETAHRATCMSLLGMISYETGRAISWDGKTEKIIGDEAASKLLHRNYRSPWKYPV